MYYCFFVTITVSVRFAPFFTTHKNTTHLRRLCFRPRAKVTSLQLAACESAHVCTRVCVCLHLPYAVRLLSFFFLPSFFSYTRRDISSSPHSAPTLGCVLTRILAQIIKTPLQPSNNAVIGACVIFFFYCCHYCGAQTFAERAGERLEGGWLVGWLARRIYSLRLICISNPNNGINAH